VTQPAKYLLGVQPAGPDDLDAALARLPEAPAIA